MSIIIVNHGGEIPRVGARMLPDNAAERATNVKLFSRELRSWRQPLFTFRSVRVDTIRSMYRMYSGDTDYWLTWDTDVDVARAPLAGDSSFLLYYTGDTIGQGWPKKTNFSLATSSSAYPADYMEMGVPPPANTLVVTGPGGSGLTRSYLVTFENTLGEEGPPSQIVTVTSGAGTWALSVIPTAPPSPYSSSSKWSLAKRHIYRAFATSAGDVEFYRVTTLGNMSTTTYNDTTSDADLVLNPIATTFVYDEEGSEWLPPPTNMTGLVAGPDGSAAGFFGNTVCECVPYHYDAWPVKYQKALPFPIVYIGCFGNSYIAYTKGIPYIGIGSSPDTRQWVPVESKDMGAVSKRSGSMFSFGAVAATPNGLASIGAGAPTHITEKFMTRTEWSDRARPDTLRGASWSSSYVGFFDGTLETGFVFDPNVDQGPLSFLSVFAHGVYCDPETNRLYFGSSDEIYEFDGDQNNDMNFDWTSKTFMLKKPTNYGAYVVDAEYEIADLASNEEENAATDAAFNISINDALPVETYADGMPTILDALGSQVLGGMEEIDGPGPWGGGQYLSGSLYVGGNSPTFNDRSLTFYAYAYDYHTKSMRLRWTQQLTDGKPKRLPDGFVSDAWKFRVSGNIPVRRICVATTIRALEDT